MTECALITGAASGIGQAVAVELARKGMSLVLVDIDGNGLKETKDRTMNYGVKVSSIVEDLGEEGSSKRIIAAASMCGELNTLVNAAGIYPAVRVLDVDASLWDTVQRINVRAPMLLTVEFGKYFKQLAQKQRLATASVVNVSSGAALRARPGGAPYTTSKAALDMVTKACALELAELGIRVNAVAPGFVQVDSSINKLSDEYVQSVSTNPLGRAGRPVDIAKAVAWLVSVDAQWITGEVLRVDGGAAAGNHTLPVHWHEPRTSINFANSWEE